MAPREEAEAHGDGLSRMAGHRMDALPDHFYGENASEDMGSLRCLGHIEGMVDRPSAAVFGALAVPLTVKASP